LRQQTLTNPTNTIPRSSGAPGSAGSNSGGATRQGSGVQPTFGGGRYYGGGSTVPYTAGARSPLGIAPILIGTAVLVSIGSWHNNDYYYPYNHPYTFHNSTATNATNSTSTKRSESVSPPVRLSIYAPKLVVRQDATTGINETKPVACLCAAYQECGCDDSGNTTFLNSLIGDGSWANLNKSLVNVADVNGTSTILLNGTLPNGTTASGGTANANSGIRLAGMGAMGYAVVVALVGCTVFLI
jgi:hypothetical protein